MYFKKIEFEQLFGGGTFAMARVKVQNSPAIRRMPVYLHKLAQMRLDECTHVSTTQLAEYMDIEPIVVRKDIALTGISGVRRVGYEVNELIELSRMAGYFVRYTGRRRTARNCYTRI